MRFPSIIGYFRGLVEYSGKALGRSALRPLLLSGLAVWGLAGCGPQAAVSTPGAATLPIATLSATTAAPPSSSAGIPPLPVSYPGPKTTYTPEPATPTPEPTGSLIPVLIEKPPLVLTASSINLELSSPAVEPLEWSESITVTGIAWPGATVSVNGVPALPAADGRFSAELARGSTLNPVLIEVIASTGAGGRAWTFTAALPTGYGVTTLIGTVTQISGDHPRGVAEETDITLMAATGFVELTATTATAVHIPGQINLSQANRVADEPPNSSIQDVAVGDRVAVSASGGRVLHLLLLPERPVISLHFSGVVVPSPASSAGDAFLTLRDGQGNQISVTLSPDLEEPPPGTLVTAILARPTVGGELRITGLDAAASSLDRVSLALERAKAGDDTEGLAGLVRGLTVTATRRLTLLDDTARSSQLRLAEMAREEFAVLQKAYNQTLARYASGPVSLEVEGIITSLGTQTGGVREMTVKSELGPLELSLPPQTAIWLNPAGTLPQALEGWLNGFASGQDYTAEYGGSEISVNQLDLGHRVIATYDPKILAVARMAAFASRRLEDRLARSLLPLAGKGEMAGTVTHLTLQGQARSVYIRDEGTGGTVIFSAPTESQTLVDGLPVPLGTDLAGREVAILFEPESGEIIEISTEDSTLGQQTVSGVISSFVSKIFPGNVTIMTSQGDSNSFTQDQDTVIRRDGRRISVNDVQPGDLVRPNTRHLAEGPAGPGGGPVLTYLSLKSPGPTRLTGTVIGIAGPSVGDMRVTITTDGLDLITLAVTEDSSLSRQGMEIGKSSLRIGDRIARATYDPITRELDQLELANPAP